MHAGHRYSDKAPGLSAAAVPAYRLLRLVLPAPSSTQDWLLFYGARVGSVTLAVTVALAVFVRQALRLTPPPRLLPLWLFALLFATPFQVYARSFFAHAFVAALLFLSFVLLARHQGVPAAAGAGLLAGVAVASEYPVAVIALCLLILAATRKPSQLIAFVLGAAAPAAILAWYHWHYFGGVMAFPSAANETYRILAERGLSGVTWPKPAALLGLFVDPAHGLLYYSPFLVLWPVVAVLSLRLTKRDLSLLVPSLGPLLLLVLISGFLPPHWRGGWCLGPRYVVAGFLLVFWLLVVRIPPLRPLPERILVGGVVYGAVLLAVCGSSFWLIPYESWNPARTVSAYFLRMGIVEFNLGVATGLPPLLSLVPPLLACLTAFFFAVKGSAIEGRALISATLLGLFVAMTVLAIPPSPAAVASSHRDGIASAILPAMRARWR
jgi:hypothetical protein